MLNERRRHQRHTINRVGKFQVDSGALPRDCMITDISEEGARLFVDSVEVPDQFFLLISGDTIVRRECRVIWRLGGEIGVAFVATPVRRDDAVERTRQHARRAFGKVP